MRYMAYKSELRSNKITGVNTEISKDLAVTVATHGEHRMLLLCRVNSANNDNGF